MSFITSICVDDEDVTVGELIASWENRVRGISIETRMLGEGVEGKVTSHDYIGFLHFRSIVDSAIRSLAMAEDSPELTILNSIDSCFMALTEPDEIGLIEAMDPTLGTASRVDHWWTKRIPRSGALGFEIAKSERHLRSARGKVSTGAPASG